MTKKERAQMIVERLEQVYPEGICSLTIKNAPRAVIAGRLSAQCIRRKGEYSSRKSFFAKI